MTSNGYGKGRGYGHGAGYAEQISGEPVGGSGWGAGFANSHPMILSHLSASVTQGILSAIKYKYPQYYLTKLIDKISEEIIQEQTYSALKATRKK